jgi:integrase
VDTATCTKEEFFEVLGNYLEQDMGAAVCEQMRSALVAQQLSHALAPWAKDADVKKAVKGVRGNAMKGKKPTGTLTPEMRQKLMRLMTKDKEFELCDATDIATLASLRIGELGLIKEQDGSTDGDTAGFGSLILRANKAGSVTDYAVNPQPKMVPPEVITRIRECAAKGYGKDGYIFGKGIDSRLRAYLKKAAITLGWSDAFAWVGPHVFRHTGSRLIKNLATTIATTMSQQTPGTFNHYAASDAEKDRKTLRRNTK